MTTKIKTDVTTADEPITAAKAKAHLKLVDVNGSHPDDALVLDHIVSARQFAEHYCGCAFAVKTLVYAADEFPSEDYIEVEIGPIGAVTSVTYRDADDAEQTFDSANYFVDDMGARDRIYLLPSASWPVTGERRNSVRVEYSTAAVVPQIVKDAMLLLVEHLYRNRGVVLTGVSVDEVPLGILHLLNVAKDYGGGL